MKSNAEAFIAVDEPSNAFVPVVISCVPPRLDAESPAKPDRASLQIAFAFIVGCAMTLATLLM